MIKGLRAYKRTHNLDFRSQGNEDAGGNGGMKLRQEQPNINA